MIMDEKSAIDIDAAYDSYVARFESNFGGLAAGAYVKFARSLIHRLNRQEFDTRLEHFLRVRARCKRMLESGATISDAIGLEFEEASAWLAIEAPSLLALFQGELGALPTRRGKV